MKGKRVLVFVNILVFLELVIKKNKKKDLTSFNIPLEQHDINPQDILSPFCTKSLN